MYEQLTINLNYSYFLIFCLQLNENYHASSNFHFNVIQEISQTLSAFRHPLHLSYSAKILNINWRQRDWEEAVGWDTGVGVPGGWWGVGFCKVKFYSI